MCKSSTFSLKKRTLRKRVIYRGGMTLNLYLRAARDRFHGYLSHSRWMFAVSLHLGFLAVLLHLLLQLLLLL